MRYRCDKRRLLKDPNSLASSKIKGGKTLIDLDLTQPPCDGCISLINQMDKGNRELLVYSRYNWGENHWQIGTDELNWTPTYRDRHVGVCVGVIRNLLDDW